MIYLGVDSHGYIKVGHSADPVRRCAQIGATLVETFDLPEFVETLIHDHMRLAFPMAPSLRDGTSGMSGKRGGREWYQPQGLFEGETVQALEVASTALHLLEALADIEREAA